ncbi:MAG: UDP-N-acetylmuramoyl-L-alanine--D-glutamate ligase [Candidatus Promineofilum sp.]|nr:UDP-N-acetylmuramoyl-L-alanine--D-glutamate ligase [Promineifilum sp.]
MDALNGKRLVILGMARQGTALARFAVGVGAFVTLSDLRPPAALADAQAALADLPADRLRFVLGEHPTTLLDDCDLLAISGGVSIDSPLVVEAQRRGIPLTNDSLEFARRAPAPLIGITGSAGKTTTTSLVGCMGQLAGRRTWVGGNIGRPPLTDLAEMSPNDLIIMELSSFQLEIWDGISPTIAAVLNITPNHLDRHKTIARYTAAKLNILRFQGPDGVAVLSADDPGALATREYVRGRLRLFSRREPVDDGAYVADDQIWLSGPGGRRALCPVSAIRLRGGHNVLNTLAAAALAEAVGVPDAAIVEGLHTFAGVPHRLEMVREVDGVKYINDSIATAPERALAALAAYDEPIILLAGGRDKEMVWDDWARQVAQRVKRVVLFGELAGPLAARLSDVPATRVDTLAEAVYVAQAEAVRGDIVLLSPGGTSFDSYSDFAERGEHFRLLVGDL